MLLKLSILKTKTKAWPISRYREEIKILDDSSFAGNDYFWRTDMILLEEYCQAMYTKLISKELLLKPLFRFGTEMIQA